MNRLRQFLVPPTTANDEESLRARILHWVLIALLVVAIVAYTAPLFVPHMRLSPTIVYALISLSLALDVISLWLLHTGKVRETSWIFVSLFWVVTTIQVAVNGGLRSVIYFGYPTVVVLANLLLGEQASILFAALSISGGLIFMLIEKVAPTTAMPSPPLAGIWFSSSVFLVVVVVLQSVASRILREAVARSRASEEQSRLISSVISDYTFVTHLGPQGELEYMMLGGAFETITGYTPQEFIAIGGWRATLHPEDVAKDDQDMAVLRTNQRIVTEVRVKRKDGQWRWVRVYAQPAWDPEHNRLEKIYGAVQDITEYKMEQVRREELFAELETKNAELERFLYTVSHDLRSPLITMGGFVGFLEKDALSGNIEQLQADAAHIKDALARMRQLLDELLKLSRIGRVTHPPEVIAFEGIAREAVVLEHHLIEAHDVNVVIMPDLPTVSGDRARLVEVVQNLVDNACKFMGNQPHPQIEIGARQDNGETVFYVRDNGIGIDPRYHNQVFGLFDKLDSTSEGIGIGLTLVKRIVETHGGRIWIESKVDAGSTFCFTLA